MRFMKSLAICECPPSLDEYTVQPIRRSPMDMFGYKAKCCGCIPLKSASIIIGLITLFWAALQIQSADKVTSDIIPDKNSTLFYFCKLFYLSMAVFLMLACGILILGIILSKFHLINIYVWYGFIYNCFAIIISMIGFVLKIIKVENKLLKHIIRVILSLTWNCLFFYFLTIVNSYKITTLWSS